MVWCSFHLLLMDPMVLHWTSKHYIFLRVFSSLKQKDDPNQHRYSSMVQYTHEYGFESVTYCTRPVSGRGVCVLHTQHSTASRVPLQKYPAAVVVYGLNDCTGKRNTSVPFVSERLRLLTTGLAAVRSVSDVTDFMLLQLSVHVERLATLVTNKFFIS